MVAPVNAADGFGIAVDCVLRLPRKRLTSLTWGLTSVAYGWLKESRLGAQRAKQSS